MTTTDTHTIQQTPGASIQRMKARKKTALTKKEAKAEEKREAEAARAKQEEKEKKELHAAFVKYDAIVEKRITVIAENERELGVALREILDRRLYLDSFPTWQAYCRSKQGISAGRAGQLIRHSRTAERQGAKYGEENAPVSEAQTRPYQSLDEEGQDTIWDGVIKGDIAPTRTAIERAVKAYKAKSEPADGDGRTQGSADSLDDIAKTKDAEIFTAALVSRYGVAFAVRVAHLIEQQVGEPGVAVNDDHDGDTNEQDDSGEEE